MLSVKQVVSLGCSIVACISISAIMPCPANSNSKVFFYCRELNSSWILSAMHPRSDYLYLRNIGDRSLCTSIANNLNATYQRGLKYIVIGREGTIFKKYFLCASFVGPLDEIRSCPPDRQIAEIIDANRAATTLREFVEPNGLNDPDVVETFRGLEYSPNQEWPGINVDRWLEEADIVRLL